MAVQIKALQIKVLKIIMAAILLAITAVSIADVISNTIRRASLHPDTKAAARAIGMSEEVKTQFDVIVKEYVEDLESGIKRIIKNNSTKFDSKIRRKNSSLVKTMDKQMAELLSENQWPRYENYQETFQGYLNLDCSELRC